MVHLSRSFAEISHDRGFQHFNVLRANLGRNIASSENEDTLTSEYSASIRFMPANSCAVNYEVMLPNDEPWASEIETWPRRQGELIPGNF